jgi:hypothetical protein
MRSVGLVVLFVGLAALTSTHSRAQAPKSDPPAKEEIKWPKEIAGKGLDQWIREMRDSRDASQRDLAIRTVPLFGPDSRRASGNLIYAMTKDPDINVRLTAINTVPLIGFDDDNLDTGLNAMDTMLKPGSGAANHTRYELTLALGNCGPIAKRVIPTLIQFTIVDPTSWQNRKAAATALGQLGQPMMANQGPDIQAVRGLIRAMRQDSSHQVRREAVSSLLQLGPPTVEAVWKELRDALTYAMKDADKGVALWSRVAYIRTEQELLKPTDPNLVAIAKLLTSPDLAVKQEAIQAIGVIGEEAKSRVPDLLAIALGKNEEPIIIATALWAMSQMPSETDKMLPAIDTLKQAPEPIIKSAAQAAHKALTEKPDPEKKKDPPPKK